MTHASHTEAPHGFVPSDMSRLLELVAVSDPGDDGDVQARALAEGVADHEALLGSAARHRMIAALAEFLGRNGLLGDYPMWFQHAAGNFHEWNRHRVGILEAEAVEIASRLREAGVTVVFNKGIVCQSSLYDRRGSRFFSDIDVMTDLSHRDAITDVLVESGYIGEHEFDPQTGQLVEISRQEKVLYRLHPDHLPHFHRLTPDTGVPYLRVDVAFSLTWNGSAWQVPMDKALANTVAVPVGGQGHQTLPTLDAVHGFLFLALHLFRECWFQRTVEAGGLRLTQFADIAKFWNRFGSDAVTDLKAAIIRYEIEPVVAWICHHTEAVFGTRDNLVETLELGDFCEPVWLASAGATGGGYLSWHGDMRARLHTKEPVRLSPAGEPPYAARARI